MKKTFKGICIAITIMLIAFCLAACNGTKQHTITFDYNYDGAPDSYTVKVDSGTHVTEPDNPSRTNWQFTKWYTDEDCTDEADFGRVVTSDATYYAGWKHTNVVVTFDLNYAGSTAQKETISVNSTVLRPTSPKRDGYNFVSWCTDAAGNNAFDFKTEISSDLILFASWTEMSDTDVLVSYMWNYEGAPDDGVYDVLSIEKGSKVTVPPVVSREKRIFEGWYIDNAGENEFDFKTAITTDISLYAKWTVVNTFEAECTDMTGFMGTGWSWSPTGTSGIDEDQYDSGAGNNAYVGNMYAKGTYIYFQIESDRDISDITLKLRLSMEIFTESLELWPEIYGVTLYNGDSDPVELDYGRIVIERKIGFGIEKFENYLITDKLDLKKGTNYIYLQTNNSFYELGSDNAGAMGSMAAFAPLVDALVIEHAEGAVQLSWMERVCNLWNIMGEKDHPCSCDKHK